MKQITGAGISALCTELCKRIGDVYTGPYAMSIPTGGGPAELMFFAKKGSYTAVPTPDGLSIKDEEGTTIAVYPDIADIAF